MTEDAVRRLSVHRFAGGAIDAATDEVAREEPLEIQIGGASLAVVMRTPGHDLDLVRGFLLTERIVASPDEIATLRHCSELADEAAEDNVVQVTLREGVEVDLASLRRNLFASSSCGVCGKATLENAMATAPPLEDGARFGTDILYDLPRRLRAAQPVFEATGGLHAAGLFAADGTLTAVREDVGRHNAVDKVIGAAAAAGTWPLTGRGLVVSGRASFEVVQKALAARLPIVAAVSAPSSLAVELAAEAGIALVGFLRGRGMNVYGARERVLNG